jgi:Ca2+-binding EF-hand superfamily protein
MKTKSIVMIAASLGLVGAAYAEEGKPKRPEHKLPPEILEKFDTNKDGKLDEAEREAAKAAREEMMKARKAEMLKKFDKDGDGKLSEEEEAAMREERKKMMLQKFDKDGDGELNDEEKAAMKKAMMEHGGPGGHRPGGNQQQTRKKGGDEAPGVTE